MRNTEQLIGSLGYLSYRIGTLDGLNVALACYGPENTRYFSRVQVKEKPGQQTSINRANIKVASFSGLSISIFLDVINTCSLLLVLKVAAQFNWHLHVSTAFNCNGQCTIISS